MAAAVMRDHAIALREEEHHLRVPVVGAQRPAVMEDDRLRVLGAPVLVEDLGAVDLQMVPFVIQEPQPADRMAGKNRRADAGEFRFHSQQHGFSPSGVDVQTGCYRSAR
jgi:hypothetical protein